MSQILVELIKLATLIITVTKSVASGNRVQEIFEIESTMLKEETDSNFDDADREERLSLNQVENIEFNNVGLIYDKAMEETLSNISMEIKKGEVIGIIGGTGSGKTSLINLIPRFYDITSGELKINGEDVKKYNLIELRKQIAVIPQKSVLFQGTIRENIRFGKKDATDGEINYALKVAQAYDFVENKKGKLDYEIEEGGKNLSGGQRQRLAIARALVTDASVIIFDDSMSALDYATDAAMRKEIQNIKDKIKIIVSQRVVSLRDTDRIVVMDDGRIVGIGNHEYLMANCQVYQEIYHSQVKKDEE